MLYSINRIRLEFKVQYSCIEFELVICINRIRLEFKAVSVSFSFKSIGCVLIESDWNLKQHVGIVLYII